MPDDHDAGRRRVPIWDLVGPSRPIPPRPPLLSHDFDCRRCGACCVEAGEVPVRPGDAVPHRLTRSVRGSPAFTRAEAAAGTRRMRRSPGTRCAALAGEVGRACACAIHDRRPAACRDFAPGSDGCLAAREVAEHRLRDPKPRHLGYGDAAEVARQRDAWEGHATRGCERGSPRPAPEEQSR